LVGALAIDPDGTYDPRLVNDRLLLGLKGTMSEYELSLLRQRGLAARDSKALRGELRFALPPGYCWNEIGQIEMDPDQRVAGAIRIVLDKFRELGSARQVMLWARTQQADGRLECFAPGSSPWLHKLGRVRGESAADIGEHPHAEAYRLS
jgi:DNA invertase Pin-like site-specific DNA recombinase